MQVVIVADPIGMCQAEAQITLPLDKFPSQPCNSIMPKTRFVCVSDTHAYTPSEAGFKLPPGDVLIHAGDLTTRGSLSELRKTLQWISAADYEVKIVICGLFASASLPSASAFATPFVHLQRCAGTLHGGSRLTRPRKP